MSRSTTVGETPRTRSSAGAAVAGGLGAIAVFVLSAGHVLAGWLGVLAAVLFAVVLLVHLAHTRGVSWPMRTWHIGHALMAAGMVLMNLPWVTVPPLLGQGVFLVLALIGLVLGVSGKMRGHGLTLLVPVSVIDLLGMAFMYVVPMPDFGWLSVLFAAWFLVQSVCWMLGRGRAFGDQDGTVRASLAAMCLGMASMLLAMQFLMGPMPGM